MDLDQMRQRLHETQLKMHELYLNQEEGLIAPTYHICEMVNLLMSGYPLDMRLMVVDIMSYYNTMVNHEMKYPQQQAEEKVEA